MIPRQKVLMWFGLGLGTLFAATYLASLQARSAERNNALAQVTRWADWFEQHQTSDGRYRFFYFRNLYLPEKDPWGNDLMVMYSQGRTTEAVTIRSASRDRHYFTPDDIIEERSMARHAVYTK